MCNIEIKSAIAISEEMNVDLLVGEKGSSWNNIVHSDLRGFQ